MHKFTENPSEKYKKAVSALRQLLLAEGENIASRAFAESVQEARRKNFTRIYEVTPPKDSHVCFHRLLGEKCPDEKCFSPQIIPHADHCSEWQKDGKTQMIVCQPYYLSFDDIKTTVEFCKEYGLEAMIEAKSSWHFPGTTINVQYKRPSEITK